MASTHDRKWPAHRKVEHSHENEPPHQEKYARGDDDWNMKTTACPVDSPLVTDGRKNSAIGASLTGNYMHPVYDEAHDSAYIHDSKTDSQRHDEKKG